MTKAGIKYRFILLLMIAAHSFSAQCLLKEITLSDKVNAADLIIEGSVKNQESYWGTDHRMIYTMSTLEVYKVFKGVLTTSTVNIISEGGTVGFDRVSVSTGLELAIGDVGLFTCIVNNSSSSFNNKNNSGAYYKAYAATQGFIRYDQLSAKAIDPFHEYYNIPEQLYNKITDQTHSAFKVVRPFSLSGYFKTTAKTAVAPVITSFSPATITGGTKSQLTINGSGFGASRGSGTVGFKNADNGGSGYINPLASQYISWSDSKIVVEVPSKAGTGIIMVTQGSSATTSTLLTVSYSELNVNYDDGSGMAAYQTDHVNSNGSGGYTWQMNTAFNTNTAANTCFMRAFDTWRCNTGVNWTIGSTTSVNTHGSDNINLIAFDDNDPLPAGVAGTCYTFWTGCSLGTLLWYAREMDILFDNGSNISPQTWQYGPALPSSGQYDFESIAAHELGHGRQLAHIINSTAILNYSISNGQSRRTLSANDIAGGNDIQSRSIVANTCGPGAMTNFTGCPPTADFSSDKTMVCVGDTVKFSDKSVGVPTSWSWTFNGGTPSSSNLQNPEVKYISPGTYTVSLSVSNSKGSNTKTVNGYITVSAPILNVNSVNVTCYGKNTGSATVSSTGGVAPYTYRWNNGYTTASVNNLASGTYTCTVTDASNCAATITTSITQPSTPVVIGTITTSGDICGRSNGSAVSTASGGTGGLTYSWNNGANAQTATNLSAGNYIITVNDANGCNVSSSVTINNISGPSPSAYVSAPIICNGQTGTVTLNISNGISPYTYSWNTGTTGTSTLNLVNFSNTTAGSYTLTVADKNNCTSSTTISLTQPAGMTAGLSSSNVSCYNGNDGQAIISVSGGTSPYTYLWNNGIAATTANNLNAATYTCTVTDNLNCKVTETISISQPVAPITVSSISPTNEACGNSNGSAIASASGGSGALTYSWSNGASGPTAIGLAASTYTVFVNDDNNCWAIRTVTITNVAGPLLNLTVSNPIICKGQTGWVTANFSGGSGPYTYSWSNGNSGVTSSSSLISGNISAGSYSLLIADANNCSSSSSVSLTEPTILVAGISNTNILCYGENKADAIINVSGGVVPYSYLWNTGSSANMIDSLFAGIYTCTVTDNLNCKAISTATITQPSSPLTIDNISATDGTCGQNNGSVTATASGGSGSLTYSWNNGGSGQALTNLTANTYTLFVNDGNSCVSTATVSIVNIAGPSLTGTVSNIINCNGNTGSVITTIGGGSSPYTYSWSNGSTGITTSSSLTLSNINAGTYSILVTDANNCTSTVNISLTEPAAISAAISSQDVLCNPVSLGNATVSASGGTPGYVYVWNNGSFGPTIQNLFSGIYTVTITDNKSCTYTTSVTINESNTIYIDSITPTYSSCGVNNGSVAIAVSGGSGTLTYSWNTGGTAPTAMNLSPGIYVITITDSIGCIKTQNIILKDSLAPTIDSLEHTNVLCKGSNTGSAIIYATGTSALTYSWSNSSLGQMISNVSAGVYTVTVSDMAGCLIVSTTNITEPSTALTINNFISENEICGNGNGKATAIVSGSTGNFTYSWSNGASAQTVSGLSAGTYSLSVTDDDNCGTVSAVTITNAPGPIATINVNSAINCKGLTGSVIASTVSGNSPFTYAWSDGAIGNTTSSSNIHTNTPAGSYTITITDANNCSSSATISLTEPTSIAATINSSDLLCNGGSNGSAVISATGGTAGYTFSWSNGMTGSSATNLTAKNYIVTVTDSKGCTLTKSVTITEPNAISTPTFISKNATCGLNNGNATASCAGGTGTLTYSWAYGVIGQTITGLSAGTYSLTVTDINNCIKGNSLTITNLPIPVASVSVYSIINCNGNSGSASGSVTGGSSPFIYKWSDGAIGSTTSSSVIHGNMFAGSYTLTVTDADNCNSTSTITLTEPAVMAATITPSNILCNGAASGSTSVSATGGTPAYTFLWSNGATGTTVSNLTVGNYYVTVRDSKGCTLTRSVTLNQPNSISTPTFINKNSTCGLTNGIAIASCAGGTGTLTYSWSNGITGQTAINLPAAIYTLVVTDGNNCSLTRTNTILNSPLPLAAVNVINGINCFGTTGSVSASVTGGSKPFVYTWSDGAIGSTTSSSIIRSSVSTGTYTFTVIDADNCSSSAAIVLTQPAPMGAATASNNISCNGAANGSATANASGGTPAYTYSWSNGKTGISITNLTASGYTVTITDSKGCNLTNSIYIAEPNPIITPTLTSKNTTCGLSNGSATASSAGGTGALTYSWSNGATGTTVNNLAAGCFTVIVRDATSCTKSASTCISSITEGVISFTVAHVDCYGKNTGKATASISGGTPDYTYTWNTGSTSNVADNISEGSYTLTVNDGNNCQSISTISITQPPKTTIVFTISNGTCGQNNGTVVAIASGGTGQSLYSWSTGATGQTLSNLTAGTYTVTTSDANDCISTSVATINNMLCVWPGDADYSGIANIYDVLALGLGYGDQGPVRPGATINWVSQAANDWTNNLPNTIINEKHADCNGDGVINSGDTTAIIKNYALSHSLKLAKPDYINGTPELTFGFPVDTTLPGTNLNVPVILGSAANQGNNIYGLAFSVYYDPKIVDSTQIKFTANNSWIGINGSNLIFITKNFGSIGRMDIGITRINHQNISNYGAIGELTIPIKSTMPDLPVQKYHTLFISDAQVKAVSSDGSDVPINFGMDSVVIEMPDVIGIYKHNSIGEIKLFPNPASDIINVELNNISVKEMRLINILGETIWQNNSLMDNKISIDTEPFPSGLYYLSIISVLEKAVVQVNIIK